MSRVRKRIAIVSASNCFCAALALCGAGGDELVAVRATGLVDVRAGVLVPDAVLLVRGERIEAVGSAAEVAVPDGARSIDLGELVLVPGLIDAHVHLAWGPQQPGQPLPGSGEARATLEAGFTSV